MARRLRIQFEGAVYHVINRGNYRRDVFETADRAAAFERCLFEVCERMRWRLFAYVLMRNHYHLAVETTEPNLVEGMHWLQSTFATRFNRFRQERGHLFQGRYQALLVEPDATLGRVVDYIHLNPVRAAIVTAEQVGDFRWGSLRRYLRGDRPRCMQAETWLEAAGLGDTTAGWKLYVGHLVELAGAKERQIELGFPEMSRGWAIGTHGWRQALAHDHAHRALSPGLAAQELVELKLACCEQALDALLGSSGKTLADAAKERKGVVWKVNIARKLRASTPATNRWIAEKLCMGAPNSVSQYLSDTKANL